MTRHPNPIEDELLAIRCQLGEPAAFDEMAARWHRPLWTYVRRMTGSDDRALDVVQDVWVRVIRGIPGLRDGSKLRAWLFGIARRTLMDSLREQYARPADTDLDLDALPADPEPGDRGEDLELLERTLDRLPLVEREVLTLFYLDELSIEEVAAAMNVPAGTVKSRLFRARRLLRDAMTTGGNH